MNLSDAQRLDWLQLIRSDNVGPRTFRTLVNKFGGAGAALDALPGLLARAGASGGGRAVRIADRDACAREMEATMRFGARLIAMGEADYPAALRQIDSPPPLLCVKGEARALTRPMVAVVGARNASAAGLAFAERLVHELAEAGYVIASGLARGLDQRAHRAALRTGTIAALAGGLDRIYPPEHEELAQEICAQGALISEMPLGWEPRGRDFPRRNRIVSGVSMAVVVVEAARRSGSLITARFANEQGREVFAVPGSPLDPRAPLLSGGAEPQARLFEDEESFAAAERLWDETDLFGDPPPPLSAPGHEFDEAPAPPLGPLPGSGALAPARTSHAEEPLEERIARLLGPSPVSVDDLVRACDAAAADVLAALVDLEMQGRAARRGHFVASA